ncbi:hypothetical protein GCM10007424_02730 [Flavobacterium suaedae]|uniref:Uncharacterized protein n=1 Tax=Flavobacterium suaedae TaxID=1767027 RepID=A0ABQ1JFX8_9FLAO|nr:hypothetical protein [Flavobacterium suaedae]GGB66239.1 hypothetical protein GCM10007424_02730 [Flavobacterium suaedae]
MNSYANKVISKQGQSATNTNSTVNNKSGSYIADNRPQAVTQRKLVKEIQNKPNTSVIQFGGNRPSFSGPATKIKKQGAPLLTGDEYDMAHRLSYQRIKEIVESGNNAVIHKMVKALTIPKRTFGMYQKGYQGYYNHVTSITDQDELIKALNNSPFNLRPGNPSVNRSIGSGFDPNVDDAGYETDQSEGLEEFASQQGGQIRTSSYLSDKELSTWENKAFGGLF